MIFLIGNGGDGKSMQGLLDQATLGKENFGHLDFAVFLTAEEFMKSAHFGKSKLQIILQEATSSKAMNAETFKKVITGEDFDLR